MKLLQFIISKLFLKNLAIAIGILGFLLFVTFQGLRLYTYHGKYLQVPDLEGLSELQAERILTQKELRYVIIDSVYSKVHTPGTVVEQLPVKGAKVKKNRKLFLIMNAKAPEMIVMPDLKDISIRQARNILESSGLKIGQIMYVHSPYKNLVINQYFNNIPIVAGTRILKNSVVDLEVGKGLGNSMALVPDLKGMKLDSARNILSLASMNLGVVIEDYTSTNAKDSAFIWKQRPTSKQGAVRVGTSIDVWLTMDSTLILPDTIDLLGDTLLEVSQITEQY